MNTLSDRMARIGGPHPKYELERVSLEEPRRPRREVDGKTMYSCWWPLPGNGLYEFRNHYSSSRGFFVVSGSFRQQVEPVDKAEAFRRAGALPA